jgi:hypothetical protein
VSAGNIERWRIDNMEREWECVELGSLTAYGGI